MVKLLIWFAVLLGLYELGLYWWCYMFDLLCLLVDFRFVVVLCCVVGCVICIV